MIEKIAFSIPGPSGKPPVEIAPVAGIPSGEGNATGVLGGIIQWGITSLIIVATLLSLAFLIIGGIQWIVSGGEKEKIEAARKKITYALIGLVVVFLAFFIVNVVGDFFSVNLLNSTQYCSAAHPDGFCQRGTCDRGTCHGT